MPYKDKDAERAYKKEYHKRWYNEHKAERRKQIDERRKEIRDWVRSLRLKCQICGENHPACLDFHHEGKKDFNVSLAWRDGYSKEKILAEIKKCVVLCSNCHRKLHYTGIV